MTEHRQTRPPDTDQPGEAPPGWEEWARVANGAAQGGPHARPPFPDLSALVAIFEALRRAVPTELQEQFVALQRELLLTLRALIDWYLERLDGNTRAPQVEDIPID
jgi:hypothetical protein